MSKILTKNYGYMLIVAFLLSFSLGFFTTNGLNEEAIAADSSTYDKMKVTFVNIESRKTGTSFDNVPSDMDGHDASPDDNYVKTYDTITYVLEVGIERNEATTSPSDIIKGGKIKVRAKIPTGEDGKNTLSFLKDSWMKNYTYNNNSTEITTYYEIPSNKSAIGGAQQLSFTIAASGNEREITGDMLPIFEVWMEGNQPDNKDSIIESKSVQDTNPIIVTGIIKSILGIASGYINNNGEKNGVNGQYISFLTNEYTASGKGYENAEHHLSSKLKIKYEYRDESVQPLKWIEITDEDGNPSINGTELIAYGRPNEPTEGFWPDSSWNKSSNGIYYYASYSGYANNQNYRILFDAGTMNASQDGNIINFSNDDFYNLSVFDNNVYKLLAAQGFELFVPWYEPIEGHKYQYRITITDNELQVQNHDRVDQPLINPKASLSFTFYNSLTGSFIYNFISDYYVYDIDGTSLSYQPDYSEMKSLPLGKKRYYYSSLSAKDGPYEGGLERLIVWNSDSVEFSTYKLPYYSYSNSGIYPSPKSDDNTIKYGVYKENREQGVLTNDLVNSATFDDFDWYDTVDEANNNGKITALWSDEPTWRGYNCTANLNMYLNPITDINNVGKSGIIRHWITVYGDAERTQKYNIGYGETSNYKASIINDTGTGLSSSGSPSNIGETYFITGIILNMSHSTEKSNYNVEEEFASYTIAPKFSISLDNPTGTSDFKVWINIPKDLSYYPNSSNFEPFSIEENKDGTSTVTWEFKNWSLEEPLPKITYKLEMSPYMKNNISKSITAYISSPSVLTGSKSSSATASFTNLAGSSLRKKIDKEYLELGDTTNINDYIYNIAQRVLTDVKTVEILPKNGDSVGSSFTGSYTIKLISLADTQKMYYTTNPVDNIGLEPDPFGKLNIKNVDLDNDNRWIEIQPGDTIPSDATAIATYIPEIAQESDLHYVTEFIPSGNTYLDKYYFQVTASSSVMDNAFSSELKNIVVVDRKISGNVFIDKNKDGKYNTGDTLLSNKNVYLYDDEDNLVRTMTTDQNGYYEGEHFEKGDYYIKYNLGDGENFTTKNAGAANVSSVINPNTGKSDIIQEFSQAPNSDIMHAQNKNIGLQAAPARVITHFYEINSDRKVHQDAILEDNMFFGDYYEVHPLITSLIDAPYNTTYEVALDENNQPISTGDPTEGTISKSVMEISFYYRPKPATITVHHYFEGTTDKAFEDVSFEKTFGQEYQALRIDDDLYNNAGWDHNYDSPNGIVSKSSYEVIYYYQKKKGTVTAHHYIKGTTTKVHADDIEEYEYGLPYSTHKYETDELDDDYVDKYFYDSYVSTDQPSGTVSKDNYEMIYYYKSKSANILVHHYIIGTQIKVHPDVQFTGIFGDDYQTNYFDTKQLDYEYQNKYFYNSHEGDEPTGRITKENYVVTYYYGLKNATITVRHYLDGTTTEVHAPVIMNKQFFESYSTRPFNPADLVEPYTNKYVYNNKHSGDGLSGNVGKTSYEIIYYYEPREAEIITHYYIKGTEDKVQESKVMYKYMNESYNTRPLETEELYNRYKNKYVFSNESGGDDTTGIVSKIKYIIVYYYEPKPAKVTVHHYAISKDGNRTTNKVYADEIEDTIYTATYTTKYKESNQLAGDYNNNYYYNNEYDGDSFEGTVNTDNVVVNYYYRAKPSRVVVHHYIKGTTTKVHADDVYNKLYTDPYETRAFKTDELIGNYQNNYYYNGDNDGDALSGTINKDSYDIIYYYELRPSTITVHHYIKGTTTEVHPDDVIDTEYTLPYSITPYEPNELTGDYFNNYYYHGDHDGDALSGTVNKDSYEITIYYEPRPSVITVHHYIEGTITKVHKDDVIDKHYGDNYETNYYGTIELNNPYKNLYTYVSSDGDQVSGRVNKDSYDIIYYYNLRPSTLTVHHYIINTETSVHQDDVISKKFTDTYETKPYDTSELEGTYNNWYEYVSIKAGDSPNGTIIGENYEVTYYYDKLPAKLTVHHYILDTTTSIADDEVYNLKLRDHYETHKKEDNELNKLNYTYDSIVGEASGNINDPELEITYYYSLKKAQIIVHHIAEDTKEELCYDEISDATYQDFYTTDTCTSLNDINYTYKSVETNDSRSEQRGTKIMGNVLQDVVEITYYYELKPGQIIVHYFEVGTRDRVADDVISDGLASKEFVSEAKEIEGFILVNAPESNVHTYEVDTQEVIYEYERIPYNIEVEVIGGIGEITGAEEVPYGRDSTEDFIVITPGEGYEIDEILIDGEPIEGVVIEPSGMTLENFKNVIRDHKVEVSFKEQVIPVPITGSNAKYIVLAIVILISIALFVLTQKKLKRR